MSRAAGPLIHLGTRCGSIDEFVERFAPFATETSLVMPTSSEVAPGTEGRFVIHLKDRSPVMSGRCRVEEVKPVAAGANGGSRMVMRVRLLGMDEASRNVHKLLLASKRPPPPPAAAVKPPPLRIVRAPTLIGTAPPPIRAVPPPIGTAPTLIGTVAPPVPARPPPIPSDELVEKTVPSIRPVETQAPSAAFTLPANPLSELEAEDLASFIECTLFEADGDGDGAPERPASDDAKTPRALLAEDEARPAPPPPSPASAADDLELAPPRSVLRRRLVRAAPFALCTVIGVLVGALLRGSPSPVRPGSRAASVETPAAPSAAAPVVARPAPAPAPAEPASAPVAPAPAAPVVVPKVPAAREGCTASVASEPPDAVVEWAGRTLGHTPLRDVAVPCGEATLTLRHERYRDVTRAVTADPSGALVVSERLRRPMGTLVLTSSPPRASFTVNHLPLGPGQHTLSTWRYETVHVEATLPGYAPWSRSFYFKEETQKVTAQLVPLSKPAARPTFRR